MLRLLAKVKNAINPERPYHLNVVEYPRDAPKLVFLHGLGGTHRYWLRGLDQLKQDYHLILVDLLGFGDSNKPWINYTKKVHLTALSETLGHLGQFTLVGHSLGAALSLAYAAKYPGQVLAQILISLPYFPSEKSAYQWMRRTPSGWFMTNMVTAILTCLFTRRVIGKFLPRIFSQYPQEITEDLLKHNIFSSTTSLWQLLYHSTIQEDASILDKTIPTLFIHSQDDDSAPFELLVKFVKQNQHWQMFSLLESSHHPWLWQNHACLTAMYSFIESQCIQT